MLIIPGLKLILLSINNDQKNEEKTKAQSKSPNSWYIVL